MVASALRLDPLGRGIALGPAELRRMLQDGKSVGPFDLAPVLFANDGDLAVVSCVEALFALSQLVRRAVGD
ncbi:hypothetical protein [Phenylobacterium sp.]|uniref:hypothetical protein n=1 Tax=Phenylobacterium sp. TaxID=1871053 RepID=UPI0025F47831|nr:hypothetical protein [Phenylobacterium sp.]